MSANLAKICIGVAITSIFVQQDLTAQILSQIHVHHNWIVKAIPELQLGPPDVPVYVAGSKNPIQISAWGKLYDRNVYYFDNAVLTVSISWNVNPDDRLVILQDYNVKTYDAIIEKQILLNGLKIGTYRGGNGYTPLVITFNQFADQQAVEAVLGHIGYYNVSKTPSLAVRKVSLVMTNGYGGTSREVIKSIVLQAPK